MSSPFLCLQSRVLAFFFRAVYFHRSWNAEQLVAVICLLVCFLGNDRLLVDLALLVPHVEQHGDWVVRRVLKLVLNQFHGHRRHEGHEQMSPERLLRLDADRQKVRIVLPDIEDLLDLLTAVVCGQYPVPRDSS